MAVVTITAADVAAYLQEPNQAADPWLVGTVVPATSAYVNALPHVAMAADDDPRLPMYVQGAIMLAGRSYRRRATPGGVSGFDGAPPLSARNDPDIAMMLRTGSSSVARAG